MPDRIFIDTNILVYFVSDDKAKRTKAEDIIFSENIKVLSTQVINEFINVSFKKNIVTEIELNSLLNDFINNFEINLIHSYTIKSAVDTKIKYQYSYYDSLIIASALENNCDTLFSEDLQNNQKIEESLTIINPFA
jgi:predicted nucleic acid-binding protein